MARNEKEEGLELEKGSRQEGQELVADRKDRNQAFSNETLDWFKACSITDTVCNFSN